MFLEGAIEFRISIMLSIRRNIIIAIIDIHRCCVFVFTVDKYNFQSFVQIVHYIL